MEGKREARSDNAQTDFGLCTCMILLAPERLSQSQRKRVQYEANINHISKNNTPAAPASLCSSPFSFCVTAASPGVCSIKHSPLRGAGMYQGKVKNKKEGCLLQTMRYVQLFL